MNEFDQRPEPEDGGAPASPRLSRGQWFLQRLQRVFLLIAVVAGALSFINGPATNHQQRLYRILVLGFAVLGYVIVTVCLMRSRSAK